TAQRPSSFFRRPSFASGRYQPFDESPPPTFFLHKVHKNAQRQKSGPRPQFPINQTNQIHLDRIVFLPQIPPASCIAQLPSSFFRRPSPWLGRYQPFDESPPQPTLFCAPRAQICTSPTSAPFAAIHITLTNHIHLSKIGFVPQNHLCTRGPRSFAGFEAPVRRTGRRRGRSNAAVSPFFTPAPPGPSPGTPESGDARIWRGPPEGQRKSPFRQPVRRRDRPRDT